MGQQGSDDTIDVHTPYSGNPTAGHRLEVGDDRQGFQGSLAEPGPGFRNHRGLQHLSEIRRGGQTPSSCDTAQLEASFGVPIEPCQLF